MRPGSDDAPFSGGDPGGKGDAREDRRLTVYAELMLLELLLRRSRGTGGPRRRDTGAPAKDKEKRQWLGAPLFSPRLSHRIAWAWNLHPSYAVCLLLSPHSASAS